MSNIFVVLGSAICILAENLDDKVTSLVVLIVGRFIYGLACGSFSLFCPKYIAETSPVEIKGPTGFMSQINICFGILMPFLIGQALTGEDNYKTLCYVLFILPIALSALQILLLLSVFRYETPPVLK